MAALVGLPYRDDIRGLVGDIIIIPEAQAFGAMPERLNITYTEVREMTFEEVLWYHRYANERRMRARIAKAKQTPAG